MSAIASAMLQQFRGGAARFHAASVRSGILAILLWALSRLPQCRKIPSFTFV